MTDPLTKAAVVALMARWQFAHFQREKQAKIRDEAAKKAEEFEKIVAQCKATCKAMGFDRDDKENWDRALAEFGPEASSIFNQARDPDMTEWVIAPPQKEGDGSVEDAEADRPPVREIALARLSAAGEAGLKAADIRKYIETTYSGPIHEKTAGMTLYRLLKDGLVRREGHTWFIVPPKAGTVNPGVAAPGSVESAK
jgi:hypothetical protein